MTSRVGHAPTILHFQPTSRPASGTAEHVKYRPQATGSRGERDGWLDEGGGTSGGRCSSVNFDGVVMVEGFSCTVVGGSRPADSVSVAQSRSFPHHRPALVLVVVEEEDEEEEELAEQTRLSPPLFWTRSDYEGEDEDEEDCSHSLSLDPSRYPVRAPCEYIVVVPTEHGFSAAAAAAATATVPHLTRLYVTL
ncbi:hypothetical protein AXG93_421s1110 [Marchantia polymorpha subsp. ruderalis]|uniref:Uncharacterized protein n=1 Tax=Marchantia polymorpha subsp. ruderalis TaxID=1480154 RepID=A0A176VL79_MARPO|nr:hypothetical protein AXG93_421s1110 [Marchantia polymorpha subsp. ruderalis]